MKRKKLKILMKNEVNKVEDGNEKKNDENEKEKRVKGKKNMKGRK